MVSSSKKDRPDRAKDRSLLGDRLAVLSDERKRLDSLVEEFKALKAGGPSSPPAPPAPPKTRRQLGLTIADLAVLVFVINALITSTPLGSLAGRVWGWMLNDPSDVRPLLSYFSQPSQAQVQLRSLQDALRRAKAMRRRTGDPSADPLAVAVAFLLAEGVEQGAHFDVRLPTVARDALASVAVVWPGDASTARQREAALGRGLARLRQQFGADEAAVAALAVSADSLAFALQRARVSGEATPGRFESFGRYLPHEERKLAAPLVNSAFALAGATSMAWPIDGGRVSSPFGFRKHPVLGRRRLHKGVDIAVPIGTPVKSIQSGKVTFVGSDGVNGRFMRVDHGHGLTSTYCHLDRATVRQGQFVNRAQPIAASGNTGRSTGPHLHFQVELGGTPVDPDLFR